MPHLQPPARTARPIDPPQPFACGVHGAGRGAAWVSARGELDIASAPQLQETLQEVLGRALLIIIDLRELTFIDSTGVHVIIDADDHARQTGHRLVLICDSGPLGRLFALLGLTDRLKIVDLQPILASADPRRVVSVSGAGC
jgi:anti-sigma B factor antagonist